MASDFIVDTGIAIPDDFHSSNRKYPFEERGFAVTREFTKLIHKNKGA